MNIIKRKTADVFSSLFRRLPIDYGYDLSDGWDLLIVLDACRWDLINSFAGEYGFIEESSVYSNARTTGVWMEKNFSGEHPQTGYICGSPKSEKHLDIDSFSLFEEVWRYAWDEELGTLPPREITDFVINSVRDGECERYVAHYMQPHYPFILDQEIGGEPDDTENIFPLWGRFEDGTVEYSETELWEAYRRNLGVVLEDVEILLNNVDANEVLITSDHGNLVGEMGKYGHGAVDIPAVRRVPWIETEATNQETYHPGELDRGDQSRDVKSRLRDLGYYE